MASPITITPTLKNEASAKFNAQLEKDKDKKLSTAEKERIFSIVHQVVSKSKA